MARTIEKISVFGPGTPAVLAETAALPSPAATGLRGALAERTRSERLGSAPTLTLSFVAPGQPEERFFQRRSVVRTAYADEDGQREGVEMWQVQRVERQYDGSRPTRLVLMPLYLSAGDIVLYRRAFGRAQRRDQAALDTTTYGLRLTGRTLEEAARYVLGDPAVTTPPWFRLGTIGPGLGERIVDVDGANGSLLSYLRALAEAAGCEWRARWVEPGRSPFRGSPIQSDYFYAIDFVRQVGDPDATRRFISGESTYFNRNELAEQQDDRELITAVSPYAAAGYAAAGYAAAGKDLPAGEALAEGIGIGGVTWAVTDEGTRSFAGEHGLNGTYRVLRPDDPDAVPTQDFHRYKGGESLHFGSEAMGYRTVEHAHTYPHPMIVLTGTLGYSDDAGRWATNGDGMPLRTLVNPSATAALGLASRGKTFGGVSPYENLLSTPTLDAALAEWETYEGTPPPPPPQAQYTWTASGLAVDFQDESTAGDGDSIASRAWDFGDGQTGSGAVPSHTYEAAGSYEATLQIVTTAGYGAARTLTVEVESSDSGGGGNSPAEVTASLSVDPQNGSPSVTRYVASAEETSGTGQPLHLREQVQDQVERVVTTFTAETATILSYPRDRGEAYTVAIRVTDQAGTLLAGPETRTVPPRIDL